MQNSLQKAKIVFLGDMSVGKTSVINRFIFDTFTGNQQPTVGVDFVSKTIITQKNKTIRLQLWDTAGQDRFHSLIPSYIRDSQAAVIIYDITNQASYNNLNKWIQDVREVRGEDATIFILGNKLDREVQRTVKTVEAQKKTQQLGFDFFQISAKEGTGIKQFFKHMSQKIGGGGKKSSSITTIEGVQQQNPKGSKLVNPNVDNPEKKKKRNCC